MKRSITIICLLAGVVALSRPLYLMAISDCERPALVKYDWVEASKIVGTLIGNQYAIHKWPITFDLDTCINDPNLQYEIVGSVPIEGNTVTWSGDKGIHYLYFQMWATEPNAASGETVQVELLHESTVAINCVPRGQFVGVTWR